MRSDRMETMADRRPLAYPCTASVILDWTSGSYRTASCWFGQPLLQVGECREGCCTDFQCPDCGHTFRYEWPD